MRQGRDRNCGGAVDRVEQRQCRIGNERTSTIRVDGDKAQRGRGHDRVRGKNGEMGGEAGILDEGAAGGGFLRTAVTGGEAEIGDRAVRQRVRARRWHFDRQAGDVSRSSDELDRIAAAGRRHQLNLYEIRMRCIRHFKDLGGEWVARQRPSALSTAPWSSPMSWLMLVLAAVA